MPRLIGTTAILLCALTAHGQMGQINGGPPVPIANLNVANASMGIGYISQTVPVSSGTISANTIAATNSAGAYTPTVATAYSGIAVSTVTSPGNVEIARSGVAGCLFDGATTAGDTVVPSTTTLGQCHDSGSSVVAMVSCLTPIVGTVTATASSAAVVPVRLHGVGTFGTLCLASVGTSPSFPSASIQPGASQTQTVTVAGATTAMGCEAEPLTNPGNNSIAFTCYVTGTGTNNVTLYETNTNQASLGGAAVTPNAVQVRYRVF